MAAAARGQPDVVRELLAMGADPNARNHEEWTALLAAVENGNEEVVLALVQAEADIQAAPWDGLTPLRRAEVHANEGMIVTLKESGRASTLADLPETNRAVVVVAERRPR
jgi:ankyrin repeat protein